jgi:hypothetical protein
VDEREPIIPIGLVLPGYKVQINLRMLRSARCGDVVVVDHASGIANKSGEIEPEM